MWNAGHIHPADYAETATTAFPPTAVRRPPLFRDNSYYRRSHSSPFFG